MDSMSQPSRPPRSTRGSSAKDPSAGLLMNVIRNFTINRDVADRDREKQILEREFKDSDRRLEQLVLTHHQDLTAVLQAFRKISSCLRSSKERVKANREKLLMAQKLLDCKRDELRKLWLESVENKQILDLLACVESLIKVPEEVATHIGKKHYLHATDLLVKSVDTVESGLSGVDGLKELKSELISKKDDMYELLIEDLHKHAYQRTTQDVIKKFRRSDRRTMGPTSTLKSGNALTVNVGGSAIRRRHSSGMQVAMIDVEEDIYAEADPEDDSRHFMVIALQSLARLNKLPDAVELIKVRCDQELIGIIKRTGKELLGEGKSSMGDFGSDQGDGTLLQDFIDLLHQQLSAVVSVHENVILPHLRRLVEARPADSPPVALYSISDVRAKIQAVLQLISDLYLEISATDTTLEKPIEDPAGMTADISSYFVKKRVLAGIAGQVGGFAAGGTKTKKSNLFRFDQSSHAMSLNAYFEEQKNAAAEAGNDQTPSAPQTSGGGIPGTEAPRYQLSEYIQLVQLLHRSLPGRDPSHLEANMKKLTEVLNELAESV